MSPLCEKEFIIVMKSPNDRAKMSLTSFLTIRLANATAATSHLEKRLKPMGEGPDDFDIETLVQQKENLEKEIRVMLIGKLENP